MSFKNPIRIFASPGSEWSPVWEAFAKAKAQSKGVPLYGYHPQKSGVPRFFPDGFAVKNQDFIGISINPSPDYATVARAFDGYGEKVEEPGEVRAALQRGLKAIAGGQFALIDVRLAKAAETNERPDRAN